MASYPMTPASALQVFIAKYGEEFNIIFEQSEDEISAINMGIRSILCRCKSINRYIWKWICTYGRRCRSYPESTKLQ